jgi:hypothetical protein
VTATLPPHADVRDCRLYRFRVYHPDDMYLPAERRRVVVGYIGETVRQPLARLLEHLYDQPWADTIVGWDVDPRIFPGKAAVLDAERAAVEAELPLYNVEWNRGNGHRVPPPVAIRQRRARDAARNAPRWVHPDDRASAGRTVASTPVRKPRKAWRPWRKHLLSVTVVWLVLSVAGWAGLGYLGVLARDTVIADPVAALLVGVWGWFGFPWLGKRWRRRFRNARRRFR